MIRHATAGDGEAIWRILEPTIRAGETYALPRNWEKEEALAYWLAPDREVFVAEEEDGLAGTYYLRANQSGGGSHVANAGYVTAVRARGRGIARQMGEHSLDRARERGFRAMQFNFVVASNSAAVKLWQALGFETVGSLPSAFQHPRLGLVDALVMFREL